MRIPAKSFLILLPGTIWGVSFVIVELTLDYIGPITMTMLRALISTLALWPAMRWMGGYFPRTWRAWVPFFWLACANQSIPFALTAWGQQKIEAGMASILLSTMPLFTVLLAALLIEDEILTRRKVGGISLGLIGIVMLIGPSALSGLGSNILAQLAVVVSALLYAVGAVSLRRVYAVQPKDMSAWGLRLRVANAQFVMSFLMLIPFSFLLESPLDIRPPLIVWGYLLMMGIGITLFATLVYFYLIEELGAGSASMTTYLIPVAGVLAGVFVLGEQVSGLKVIALLMILSGVFVANRSST